MIVAALGTAWTGGWAFAIFWIAAGAAIIWEWQRMVRAAGPPAPVWLAAGIPYALLTAAAAIAIRSSPDFGLVAILWLFATVWITDIAAYFAGRLIGGPKLWPAVSPKKTWSGAIGGVIGGALTGAALLKLIYVPVGPGIILFGIAIAVSAEAGDLFESWMKRHFGVKDSSNLIPGHGGVMDRLDGFSFAVILAAAVGWLKASDDIARGIIIW